MLFRSIAERATRCRFRDCHHDDEPGCAVREAVEAGLLPRPRLAAYLDLQSEIDQVETRREAGRRLRGEGRRPPLRRARRRAAVDHDEEPDDED